MNHGVRIILGLAIAGAIFGALAGSAIAATVGLMAKPNSPSALVGMTAAVGVALGAILFPTAGWVVLRHVPIGRALLGTFIGTVLGGVAASAWVSYRTVGVSPFIVVCAGTVAGFLVSVLVLRIGAARGKRSKPVAVPEDAGAP